MNLGVLINSLTLGGAEKIALTLCEEYRKEGINVIFVCLEKNDFYKIGNNEVHYLSDLAGTNESTPKKLFYLFIFALRLRKLVKKENISVVQSHLYRANYVNVLAKLLGSGHKAQIVNHGIVSRYKKEKLTGKVNLFLIRKLYSRADQVILNSKGMMSDLKRIGRFRNNICVINNPFNLNEILRLSREALKEDEFAFNKEKTYLIAVGRLEKVKRITDIVKAVKTLKEASREVELIILGDGSEKKNILDLIDRLQLKDRVHLLGRVTNPFKYIAIADILVSASEYEGFSNVIVEALISGTAVISTDCESGPREILAPKSDVNFKLKPGEVEFSEFGVLVPVGDHETMAMAVEELLSENNRLKKYSENGIKRAREFDKSLIKEKYISSLKLLLEK
jgi:glycosyltransferase involved in cell wall biosynthesis